MGKRGIRNRLGSYASTYGDLLPVVAMIGVLCLIVFPLPTALLDVALAINMTLAVLILTLSMFVSHALHLSTFPTLLLIATLFRLGLNIASTRQILLNGYAGEIITAFGKLVVGGNVVVGFVIFIIVAIVQFVVLAKGSDRVAEVGARFSLDAMPGKQMAIDADVRAGMLNKADAAAMRKQLEQTSQFYGAMDGATKFVKGDAIAGLLIALVNVVGGVLIGSMINGHPLGETAKLYTVLTVGDGLVSQIPSLLIAFASGILITRVASLDTRTSVGADIAEQISAQPKALLISGIVAIGLAMVPGFPSASFMILAVTLIVLGLAIARLRVMGSAQAQQRQRWAQRDGSTMMNDLGDIGLIPALQIRVVPATLSRLNARELDERLLGLRQRFQRFGVPYPGLRLSGDSTLDQHGYAIDVDGVAIFSAQFEDPQLNQAGVLRSLLGLSMTPAEDREQAFEARLMAHVEEVLSRKPWRFLGVQEVSYLIERLSLQAPKLADLLTERIPLVVLRDIFVALLKSGIDIRNMRAIAEAMAGAQVHASDVEGLISAARAALSNQISKALCNANGTLCVAVLDPELESYFRDRLIARDSGRHIDLQLDEQQEIAGYVLGALQEGARDHEKVTLVTGSDLRRSVEELLRRDGHTATVLAVEEISDEIAYEVVLTIEAEGLNLRG